MYNNNGSIALIICNDQKYLCPVKNGNLVINNLMIDGIVCQDNIELPINKAPEIIRIAGNDMGVITFMKTENAVVFCCDSRLVEDNMILSDIQRYYYDTDRGIIAVFSGSNVIHNGSKEINVLDFIKLFIENVDRKNAEYGIHPLETINVNGRFNIDYPNYDFGDTTIMIAFNSLSRIAILSNIGISNVIQYKDINKVFYEYGNLMLIGRTVFSECDIKNNSNNTDNAINFSKKYMKAVEDIYSILRRELGWRNISPVGGQKHSIVLYDDGTIEHNGINVSIT